MNTKVSKVELADCPGDGGKWVIYCDHLDANGEVVDSGMLQDTNKARLAAWRKEPIVWCCYCQEEAE